MGAESHRAFVGPKENYDLIGAMQFNLLTFLGLREGDYLCDIGCGSLRSGRLFIPYLLPGRYFGIEPEKWLVDEGIKNEIGEDLARLKKPTFSNDSEFSLSSFGHKFDFVLAHSVFSHASVRQITRCLSQFAQVMHEKSIFVASFFEAEKDYRGDDWVYPRGVTYRFDTIARLAGDLGLSCQKLEWIHPTGQTWLAITSKDSKASIPKITDLQLLRQTQVERDEYKRILATLKSNPLIRFGLRVIRFLQ